MMSFLKEKTNKKKYPSAQAAEGYCYVLCNNVTVAEFNAADITVAAENSSDNSAETA